MDKKRIFKDFFVYSAGNYISQGVGMLSGFLLRVFLEPYYMGIWQGLSIINSYTSYTNLGVSRSAAREIPYFIGKKEHEKGEVLKNVGLTFSLITIVPVGLGCMAVALIRRHAITPYIFWGLIAIGAIVILERLESYIVTILRSKKKFFIESAGKTFTAVINIALVLILVKHFKLYGLYGVDTLVFVGSIIFLILFSKEHFKFLLRAKELKHLIKIGIPLTLLGFMSVNVASVDKLVILKMLGAEKLGLYGIAIMMGGMVNTIANMASIVVYPRFQETYGANDNKKEVHSMMLKVMGFLCIPLLLLVGGGVAFLPYIIKWFIPKYIGGIAAMKFFLLGIYFFALSTFCSNFLVTINKQIYCLFACAATILVNLALSITAVKLGWGIAGVALATSVSYFFHLVVFFILTFITARN